MAILITGGAGYIGRWLARELIAQGVDTVAFDRLAPDPKSSLPLPPEVAFIEGDITNRAAVIEAATSRPFTAVCD